MRRAEFDRHAGCYREVHRENIAVTGEPPEYFADYKMRDFARLVSEAGLPEDGRFLDFGSGIGASIEPFRANLPMARLSCADVSAESLAVSRARHGAEVEYLWIPDGLGAVADAAFDGAFACCVFHHIPQEQQLDALSGLRRVVKPGGLLMIYEHNPWNPLTVRAVSRCPLDENAVLISSQRMRELCALSGWTHVRRDYRVFFPAPLRALRGLEERLRWLPMGAQYFVCGRA